jgi:hypothetical protein
MTKTRIFTAAAGLSLLMAATAFGQNRPSDTARVHRTPMALKKTYTPASVRALPGLQCSVYPGGSTSSTGVTVFTDDDGYARFHAVRADAGDKVQRLTLDCTGSDGNFSSYSADLTSAETFVPRPLNLANERGTDRPALQGDPLGYTQSELIQAGYGLRPDPTDAGPYSRWLAAASRPGRFLEIKRPNARPQATPSMKGTAPPWTGSVMTGAPKYLSIEADFSAPLPFPVEMRPLTRKYPYGTAWEDITRALASSRAACSCKPRQRSQRTWLSASIAAETEIATDTEALTLPIPATRSTRRTGIATQMAISASTEGTGAHTSKTSRRALYSVVPRQPARLAGRSRRFRSAPRIPRIRIA